MELELGGYEVKSEADVRREAAIKGFNFLRKSRTTTKRVEELGLFLADLTHVKNLHEYPDIVTRHWLTKEGNYIPEHEAKDYKPKTTRAAVTEESMIVVKPVRLKGSSIVAVRKKSDFEISQLVAPDMITYVGSVASTDEVIAGADSNGRLFGPMGGLLPISTEYVESLDAVLTEYSTVLGLPRPGEL